MSTLINRTEVSDVTAIQRPGVGPIYRAIITIGVLYEALRDSAIRYAPRYQRGFRKGPDDNPEENYDLLLPINDDKLQLDVRRAQAMAVKFLMALNNDLRGKRLFTSFVVWNARRGDGRPEPKLHPDGTLELRTVITVPDTGHRHLTYFLLGSWKHKETSIPDEVNVDGDIVTSSEILKWLEHFDPDDPATSSLFVDIYNLDAEQEGWLYDEFNADAKPPAGAVAIDLNQHKTPSRRFVYRLMERSPIFARTEVETRANTIGSRSRKLTTNATMESAIRPYSRRLAELERDGSAAYDDLISFFAAFFAEWANHFPVFRPEGTTAEQRHEFRKASFAMSNIMFFPLFRLVFELWEKYHRDGAEWTKQDEWRDAIARLAGKTTVDDPDNPGQKIKVEVMSRDNPEWRGVILVAKYDSNGAFAGWSLSSTRQTRDSAFHYLVGQAKVSLPSKNGRSNRKPKTTD